MLIKIIISSEEENFTVSQGGLKFPILPRLRLNSEIPYCRSIQSAVIENIRSTPSLYAYGRHNY